MRTRLLLALAVGLLAGGRSPAVPDRPPKPHKPVPSPWDNAVANLEKLPAVLEAVKDENTAQKAVTALAAQRKLLDDFAQALQKLDALSPDQAERVRGYHRRLRAAWLQCMRAYRGLRSGDVINNLPPSAYIQLVRGYRDVSRSLRDFDRAARRLTPLAGEPIFGGRFGRGRRGPPPPE